MVFLLNITISLTITVYFLLELNNVLVVLLLFLLLAGQIIGYIANKKVVKIRLNRIKLANEWSRSMVKIIMSKVEILQS